MRLFDPIQRSAEVEKIVMSSNKRLYDGDKFRYMRFYSGIASCASRGCNLRCLYCFNFDRNEHPECGGAFYRPSEVAAKLEKLAGRKTDMARVTGCESILGEQSAKHLVEIIRDSKLFYVVETNAVAIGANPKLLNLFEDLDNYQFRVSLKATDGLMWEKITGSSAYGFAYQQRAIKELLERHIRHKVAFMPRFVDYRRIDYDNPYALEDENMRYYPGTKARLKAAGLA